MVSVPVVPRLTPWANLAYGFEDGGRDDASLALAQLVVVDAFDASAEQITAFRNEGKLVMCYLSAGSAEDWRPDVIANRSAWDAVIVGDLSRWEGEAWLDISQLPALQALMQPRVDMAAAKGCQLLEFDNVDCHVNSECFGNIASLANANGAARAQAQRAYNTWQVSAAHAAGLGAALKNAVDLIDEETADLYDLAVNEEAGRWDETELYGPFLERDKAVLAMEYRTRDAKCAEANALGIMRKFCAGRDGLCNDGSTWTDCYDAATLPTRAPTAATAAPTSVATLPPSPEPAAVARARFQGEYIAWTTAAAEALDVAATPVLVTDLDAPDLAQRTAEGFTVVCGFSGGRLEESRADVLSDIEAWRAVLLSNASDTLDMSHPQLKALMATRLHLAADRGCAAVSVRDLDRSENRALDESTALYAVWMARFAVSLGMPAALQEAPALAQQRQDVAEVFEFALARNCLQSDCETVYASFLQQGKPVLNVEVVPNGTGADSVCHEGDAALTNIFTKVCGSGGNASCYNCFITAPPGPGGGVEDDSGPSSASKGVAYTLLGVLVLLGMVLLLMSLRSSKREKLKEKAYEPADTIEPPKAAQVDVEDASMQLT